MPFSSPQPSIPPGSALCLPPAARHSVCVHVCLPPSVTSFLMEGESLLRNLLNPHFPTKLLQTLSPKAALEKASVPA